MRPTSAFATDAFAERQMAYHLTSSPLSLSTLLQFHYGCVRGSLHPAFRHPGSGAFLRELLLQGRALHVRE
jgi:hypothetical protein